MSITNCSLSHVNFTNTVFVFHSKQLFFGKRSGLERHCCQILRCFMLLGREFEISFSCCGCVSAWRTSLKLSERL